ncbi:MAG: hypothetical protein CM15mP58_09350 [Burkholderiaceae bacterium]|nr:MAG: hypothetical protein CM15mP58_09350 [Burkholderiaceae bacterium]
MSITLFLFSLIDFSNKHALVFIAILAILLAFFSSSFDVVFDAWRTEILPKKLWDMALDGLSSDTGLQ